MPKSLETILIRGCSIAPTGIPSISHIVYDLRRVRYINAKNNMFKILQNAGSILGNATSIVDFSDNYISDIENAWFQRANLSHLNLSGNFLDAYFKDETSEKFLDNELFIQNISFARNKIDKIPSDLFKIRSIYEKLICHITSLKTYSLLGPI